MKVNSSEILEMDLFQRKPPVTLKFDVKIDDDKLDDVKLDDVKLDDGKLDDGNKAESGKILVPCQHYETNRLYFPKIAEMLISSCPRDNRRAIRPDRSINNSQKDGRINH
jgi:hypothetical protein